MLNKGFRIILEISKGDVRAEVAVNAMGRVVNIGVDLKSWKTSITKKPYSIMMLVGPLMLSLIHLEKMNNYFNNLIKNKSGMDYTEM